MDESNLITHPVTKQSPKVYGVYTHAKPDGTVFYVGKGPRLRSRQMARYYNPRYMKVVGHCGKENIIISWIACETEQAALSEEVRLIAYYRSIGIRLSNYTDGGEGISGYTHNETAREKIGAFWRGKKRPPEHTIACKIARNKPERIEASRASSKAVMADPAMRKKIGMLVKLALSKPEIHAKLGVQKRARNIRPNTGPK